MKHVFFLTVLTYLLIFKPDTANAAREDFEVTAEVTYEVVPSGTGQVTHNIVIRNTKTEIHATSYSLSLDGEPSGVKAFDEDGEYLVQLNRHEGNSSIDVIFPDTVVGEGKEREFTITYEDKRIVEKSGEVYEIVIPRLENYDEYESYTVRLMVPSFLGEPAYMTPEAMSTGILENKRIYYFDGTRLSQAGVTTAFGQKQFFSIDLTYRLQNPLAFPSSTEIALPPDTAFQKVSFSSISPRPDDIRRDADGNWMAMYRMSPRERLDVRVIGNVEVYAGPWRRPNYEASYIDITLKPTYFWQSDDPRIISLAEELSSPKAVYDYVVSTLKYDYDRVGPDTGRLGAIAALESPNRAICTEFADLFVAIARAAGIPARVVNGYAYTDNAVLKPLSLVADVLHAWPEYWDDNRGIWVPVDPTWGSTTGGVDYFSKLDMRHITFAIQGSSDNSPFPPGSYKLGPNPQKDVFVSFSNPVALPDSVPEISIDQKDSLPFSGVVLEANVQNSGMSAIYDTRLTVSSKGEEIFAKELDILLPFQSRKVELALPYGFFGSNLPSEVIVRVGESESIFIPERRPAVIRDTIFIAASGSLSAIAFWFIRKKRSK